jgi:hypothetical protein
MWTLLMASVLILLLLLTGFLNHIILLLIALNLLFGANKIESLIFKNFKKPNKTFTLLIYLFFVSVIFILIYKAYIKG